MTTDAFVAFGGVAILGISGFVAAWFSNSRGESAAGKSAMPREKQHAKKQIVDEIVAVEEKLHVVSARIANL
ncbi:MAG: hypothetical protein ACHQ49_06100 [Elusimicrobiota bacterium]